MSTTREGWWLLDHHGDDDKNCSATLTSTSSITKGHRRDQALSPKDATSRRSSRRRHCSSYYNTMELSGWMALMLLSCFSGSSTKSLSIAAFATADWQHTSTGGFDARRKTRPHRTSRQLPPQQHLKNRIPLGNGLEPQPQFSMRQSLMLDRIQKLRGGAFPWSSSSSNNNNNKNVDALKSTGGENSEQEESSILEQRRKRGMSVALAAGYFTVMGAKCALPTVLALLTSPSIGLSFPVGSKPQTQMAKQLTVATLAVALGKILLGPVIDHFGGIFSLQVALSSLSALLLTISMSQSFVTFACCWTLVDFIFSSCWAASINAVHQSFERSEWANQIGNLAAAARAGNSLAFILFALVLEAFENRGMKQYWRPVFFIASLAQIAPVILISTFGKIKKEGSPAMQQERRRGGPLARILPASRNTTKLGDEAAAKTTSHPSFRASLATLRRESSTLDFWLHLISRTVLMLYASFLMFVPTLMTQVYSTSASVGAQVGSLYALGCLLSITTMSKLYAKMQRRTKLCTVALMLLVGATGSSLAQLGHVASRWTVTPAVSSFTMFVWGFSFAIPFYIPPSLYALAKGGNESSATIADVFDAGGFGLLAMFNGYVAGISHSDPSAWITTFAILTGCSLVSFLSLSLAIWREED